MKTVLATLLLLGGAQGMAHAAPTPGWSGTYVYEEDGGRTAGGTVIFITHTLQLWRKNGNWTGRLESNGYQTYINAVVAGKARGNQMDILFQSRDPETRSPLARRGDRLFSLLNGPNRRLQTRWGVFYPVSMEKAPRPGIYFRRKT
ncbi:hypothetical protein EON80_26245, partial [bacterium]